MWGKGANSAGYQHPGLDRIRCTNCGRWAKIPVFYELDRVLCERCQEDR